MENTIRLKVNNFNFYYDKFQALKDINMEIQENKVTALRSFRMWEINILKIYKQDE